MYCTGGDPTTDPDVMVESVMTNPEIAQCVRECAISKGVHIESSVIKFYFVSLFGMVLAALVTG